MIGVCKDCLFIQKDYQLLWDKDFNFSIDLALYCSLCDIFKKPEGYCDCYEES